MRFLIRLIKRTFIFILVLLLSWIIVTQVYGRLDQQIPFFISIIVSYIILAYLILPRLMLLFLKIKKSKKIPNITRAGDGLPADPVNIILYGTASQLVHAFQKIGWYQADRLTISSGFKMMKSFIFNQSYPQAPFSFLYLFGRSQDIGFQESIDNSPRKRHHVRFWTLDSDSEDEKKIWVGAATKDLGFGFKSFSYQLSHKIDFHIDDERKYLFDLLNENDMINTVQSFHSDHELLNKNYISDGNIISAYLKN